MNKIAVITVVRDYEFYHKIVLHNPNFGNADFYTIDNCKENKYITVRYNEFLDGYDYSKESWFVFCHEDWELKETIDKKLDNLDKTVLYGPIGCLCNKRFKKEIYGLIQHSNKDGSDLQNVGNSCKSFKDVDTFDCMCIIVHSSLIKKYGLRFDENLSFDLYVEDFCINARERCGIPSEVLQIDCQHWSLGNIQQRFYDQLDYLNKKYSKSRRFYSITCSKYPIGSSRIKNNKVYFAINDFLQDRHFQILKRCLRAFERNGIVILLILILNKLKRCFLKKLKFPELAEKVLDFQDIKPLSSDNFSIGVHLHLFYLDLLDEFAGYLDNIPYSFDLYVSCKEGINTKKLTQKLKKIKNVHKIIVKEQRNRGRDILPFYVTFGQELKNYKYLLHIHTKKSLNYGCKKIFWRKNALNTLCGNEDIVRKIFTVMDKENVGLVMEENYGLVNSIRYSWFGNWDCGKFLGNVLDIPIKDKFFLFPAGSFFIASTDAIKPLFDLRLTEKDFPLENGQLDGTIAHGLERMISIVSENRGYNSSIIDSRWKKIRINGSEIPFRALYQQSETIANLKINHFKMPVFNVFDVLLTRRCFRAEDVKLLAQEQHGKDDITLEELAQAEYELAVPRVAMRKIYERALEKGKKIILINNSDYSNETVSEILKKCGYFGWSEITTLHDYMWNKRKNIYVCEFSGESDKFLIDNGVSRYYILKPDFMLGISPFKEKFEKYDDGTVNGSRYLGEKLNNGLFNSPFALNTLRRKK